MPESRESQSSDVAGLLRAWASTSALYLSGVFLPLGGLVLMLLTPQPGLSLERRVGMAPLVALVALVTVTAGVIGGAAAAAFYLAGFALLTLLLPVLLRNGSSIEVTVASVTLALATTMAVVLFAFVTTPSDLTAVLSKTLEHGRETVIEMYREAGVAPARIDQLHDATAAFVDGILVLGPSLVVIGLGATVWLNLMLVRWQQRRSEVAPSFGDLTRWRAPELLVWVLVASGYATLLPVFRVAAVAANVLVVVLAVYFLHGIAVVQYYFDRWSSPIWMRSLLYVVIAIEWLFALGIVLVGIFDLWADFRRLTPRPVVDEED